MWQYREGLCPCNPYQLLQKNHVITVDEYEDFEVEYDVYKGLGGNHKGDALHARVVEKFDK